MSTTALVTGGGRGIGRAIASALAASGTRVAVGDIRADDANETVANIEAAGGEAFAVSLDVTSAESIAKAVGSVKAKFGDVNVLVNNAGWDQLKPFLDTDEAFWDRVIDINYLGVLRTTQVVLPAMMTAKWGRVVNLGSDSARVGSALESIYSGAKGAVISFTKTLAREVAKHGITANTVCPGPTDTPLLRGIVAAEQDGAKVIEAITKAVPMKRLAQPEEVAAAVAFFCSAEAGFITGQTLSVSGGLTMS